MNDAWRQIERWLAGQNLSADPGGLETSIQPTWTLPPGLIALVLLVTAAAMLLIYWHESASASRGWKVVLAGLRTLLVGLILLMMFGWTVKRNRTDLADVVVLIDYSASLALV